jgi:plasmid stabilization system protein ParE
MNYSLHQEASQDLDDAAAYYQKQAGNILSQAFLNEFEHSVERLLRHPLLVPCGEITSASSSCHAFHTRSFTPYPITSCTYSRSHTKAAARHTGAGEFNPNPNTISPTPIASALKSPITGRF